MAITIITDTQENMPSQSIKISVMGSRAGTFWG
jgi:hypothetical protein